MSDDLQRELDELDRVLRAARGINGPSGVGNAQISISAGGVGVWISAMCAVLCFVLTIVLLVLYVDQSRKVDDLEDYLVVIYTQAPHLKSENANVDGQGSQAD